MRESRVPSSRFGRLWQYGGLATSMAFGAVGESLRRATGNEAGGSGSLMLSASNMERLVAKLSRMRGAALKLGQMMSFQGTLLIFYSSLRILATSSIKLHGYIVLCIPELSHTATGRRIQRIPSALLNLSCEPDD